MPNACRVSDIHINPYDVCGCSECPHSVVGQIITGSEDTFDNNLPVARCMVKDMGIHSYCCGPMTFFTLIGSPDTFVNNIGWVRLGDTTLCCGGLGLMVTGSADTFVNG